MATAINSSLSAADHSAQLRKAVIAATIGTTIVWYDFFLYGTAAGLVFGKLYFPNSNPLTATLAAFGTYFVGFIARPVGAATPDGAGAAPPAASAPRTPPPPTKSPATSGDPGGRSAP